MSQRTQVAHMGHDHFTSIFRNGWYSRKESDCFVSILGFKVAFHGPQMYEHLGLIFNCYTFLYYW